MKEAIIKIDHILETIEETVCAVLFSLMVILGFMQVFGRYVLNNSPTWTEEVIRFAAIWLTLIGSALTIRSDGHVSVDIAIGFMKNNTHRAILVVVARIICCIFLVLFFPPAVQLVMKSTNSLAASVPIPYSYVYLAVPVGIVLMLLAYGVAIPRLAKLYKKGAK